MKKAYIVRVKGSHSLHEYAETKYEALEKAYTKNRNNEPDRSKYSCKE